MKYFTFNCGCKFPLIEEGEDLSTNKLDFDIDFKNLNLECKNTWNTLCEGNTKGCFQLESRLGQSMSKKLGPSNIEELSALISIMRPGCLEAVRDGKTVSNHFIDKKNNKETVDYFHSSLEPILSTTYGEMIYQEQAMEIAQKLAGFDLQEADKLRKAIGKKNASEMSKIKESFIRGCDGLKIVNNEEAEQIFGWIEKSQRYSFNKSHAVSYAFNAYLSAYAKTHFPKIFFASCLKHAKDKIDPQQEIKELVKNATDMNIKINVPDLRLLNQFFTIHKDIIYFGLTDIKGVGKSVFEKILNIINQKTLYEISWLGVCIKLLTNINSTASKALIMAGAMDYYEISRTRMLFEYEIISQLTKKEIEYIDSIDYQGFDLIQVLNLLIKKPRLTKNRISIISSMIDTLLKPPYSMEDKIELVCDNETELLGINLTYCKVDSYDISMTNMTCKDFKSNRVSNIKDIIIAGEIDGINIIKIKNGQNKGKDMAFISIKDHSGYLDCLIFFSDQLSLYRNQLFMGNILIFKGKRSTKKNDLIIEKCYVPST